MARWLVVHLLVLACSASVAGGWALHAMRERTVQLHPCAWACVKMARDTCLVWERKAPR